MKKVKVEIVGISKTFKRGKFGEEVKALENVNMSIREGEFACVLGPSGCGKSTLLYIVAGFIKPDEGKILIDGKEVRGPGLDRGIVFQEYSLFPWLTVEGNIEFGLHAMGIKREERRNIVKKYINFVGLRGFEKAYSSTLSGGMKQRVALARALSYNPGILLMDEPFGALDAQTRARLQKEVDRIWRETGKTIIFVTHNIREAVYLGERIYIFTRRPGKVRDIIHIHLPRPRKLTSRYFIRLEEKLLDIFAKEIEYEVPEKYLAP